MRKRISQLEYDILFSDKKKEALEHALDIRKFEIELYWKRATYFWTFIGAVFVGFFAVQTFSVPLPPIPPNPPNSDYASAIWNYTSLLISFRETKADLSVVLSCLGLVFSFGWFCVNKGSKQWQENWENHVDLLEDEITGPLYKTVLGRLPLERLKGCPREKCSLDYVKGQIKNLVTGPDSFSVSKINQIISLYMTLLWYGFLIKSLLSFSSSYALSWQSVHFIVTINVVLITMFTCFGFSRFGRTDEKEDDEDDEALFELLAQTRKSVIKSQKIA